MDRTESWIGVDLDGTLAVYTSWEQQGRDIGPPIESMMDRVRQWLNRGTTVKIFTARASDPTQVELVRNWLREQDLPQLEITNVKDFHMIELWDDRAVVVEKNTGTILAGKIYRPSRPLKRSRHW